MHEHLGFLKVSSVVVKVAAWFFLCLSILASVSLLFGIVPVDARWMGIIISVGYVFMFFFFFLIARMADLLVKISNDLKKE